MSVEPYDPSARFVIGSALQLPFADNSFDLVIASQMTHHLTDEEVVRHWRESWRVTRDGIFICDLHRNAGFYSLLWLILWLLRTDEQVAEGWIDFRGTRFSPAGMARTRRACRDSPGESLALLRNADRAAGAQSRALSQSPAQPSERCQVNALILLASRS